MVQTVAEIGGQQEKSRVRKYLFRLLSLRNFFRVVGGVMDEKVWLQEEATHACPETVSIVTHVWGNFITV